MTALRWTRGDAALQRAVEAGLARAEALRDDRHRSVSRVEAAGGDVLVKRFRVGSGPHALRERAKALAGRAPADREWRALAAVRALGLPAPAPLALGVGRDGDRLLVTEWIEGTPLLAALGASAPAERRALLVRLGRLLGRVHAAGWAHGDPHAGNVLVADGAPVLLDWQRARPRAGARARRGDLARLEHSLAQGLALPDRLRVRAAALDLERPFDARAGRALREAGRAADSRADAHARSRTRHAARDGRLCARVDAAGAAGLRLRALAPDALEALLAEHRAALAAGDARVLERDARGCLTSLARDGWRVVVKETPWRGAGRALADALRGSAGRRAWVAGHGLAARGLRAARPLAWLERRRFGVPTASWVVLEDLRPATPAAFALEQGLGEADEVLDALARVCIALHRSGVDHGDLKGTNVLLRRGEAGLEAWLVDLEGVRFRRRLADARRLRALAELNASLPDALPAAARRRAFERYARALPFDAGAERALLQVVGESLARRHRWSGAGCHLARPGRSRGGAPGAGHGSAASRGPR